MKLTATSLFATAFVCLGADPADSDSIRSELTQAAKALADQPNYSWTTRVEDQQGGRFRPGPTEGKAAKAGPVFVTASRGSTTTRIVMQDGKSAVTDREGNWQSLEEAENAPGFGRFTAALVRGLKPPAAEMLDLVQALKQIHREGEMFVGALSDEGAYALAASNAGRGARSNVVFAKGSARFWIKDGLVIKFERLLDASIDFNGTELEIRRTITTGISDVGTTTLDIPEAALAKLAN